MDIGTRIYKSGSLPWFTDVYAQRGVDFDDIFGASDPRALHMLMPNDIELLLCVSLLSILVLIIILFSLGFLTDARLWLLQL